MKRRVLTQASVVLIVGLGGACALGWAAPGLEPRVGGAETRNVLRSGDLTLALDRTSDGIRLTNLSDEASGGSFLVAEPLPLFTLILRRPPAKGNIQLTADQGWQKVNVVQTHGNLVIRWEEPKEPRLRGLQVIAWAKADRAASAVRWSLRVETAIRGVGWSVWQVVFPELALAEPGASADLFIPRGPGEVQRDVWRRTFRYRGLYPNSRTTMQFLAVYGQDQWSGKRTGLYVGVHDPWGSAKEISAESHPEARTLLLSFTHPAPDMGRAGNLFALSGEGVWRLLRGDWFDAAMVYKTWARSEARWFPRRTVDGRGDTPPWMKDLCVWAQGGGTPKECVPAVKAFAQFMGVPVGFHWYNWHQIPFDNDYPHYFPPKPGFVDGVRELQQAGVFVMPYINGRLWDTRDKGAEDFEFSRVAAAAATKDEDGKPYVESYSSKEADGSPVRLAVMCPATKLWEETVRGLVLRLFNECGVNSVYIDQIAAAPPKLCFDPMHGHPLGGGHWWNDGYWRMLDGIRSARPAGRVLTTECNAEPFVNRFDGYLTWHWQYDGQVPAFPAVYGGAVQMFGRAYRGGPTKELAMRMKAGQQLVFGEQIGWITPNIVRERENAEFLRQVVRLRWQLRRYFYAGEMARPPVLTGSIPKVRADWQWSGEWPVTTDAVLTGAWRLSQDGKLVLLFVNVSDAAVRAPLEFDGRAYGLKAEHVRMTTLTADGREGTVVEASSFGREITVPARAALAWEIRAA